MLRLRLFVLLAFLAASVGASEAQRGLPVNAKSDGRGGWTCNDGFLKRAEACVTVADATDDEAKGALVARSIAGHAGSCPCPFNRDRAGRSCGARSAYSRPGGASPMCYASDVSEAAVKQFRARYPRKKGGGGDLLLGPVPAERSRGGLAGS